MRSGSDPRSPPGVRRSPTRESLGIASLSISSLLLISSGTKLASPVTLPPGRAKLAIRPSATGSTEVVITIGMVVVAFFAANTGAVDVPTMTSTLRRTSSAASSGRRSFFCSANRYSKAMFFPSIQPSLLSSCRNASTRTALPEAVLLSRKPMRKTFPACCAETGTQSAKSMALKLGAKMCFFICAFSYLTNDFRRPRQYVRWNRNTDLLGSLEIYHELELRRLLDGQFSGLGSLQDSVHVIRDAPVAVREVRSVVHETSGVHRFSEVIRRR